MITGSLIAIAILLISFGIWGIWKWNAYSKLLSDIKEFFDKSNI